MVNMFSFNPLVFETLLFQPQQAPYICLAKYELDALSTSHWVILHSFGFDIFVTKNEKR